MIIYIVVAIYDQYEPYNYPIKAFTNEGVAEEYIKQQIKHDEESYTGTKEDKWYYLPDYEIETVELLGLKVESGELEILSPIVTE